MGEWYQIRSMPEGSETNKQMMPILDVQDCLILQTKTPLSPPQKTGGIFDCKRQLGVHGHWYVC